MKKYNGKVVFLSDNTAVKILGKCSHPKDHFFAIDLDGRGKVCYDGDIKYIMEARCSSLMKIIFLRSMKSM